MKRVIKFRGKNNSGKWVYGAYAAFKGLQGAIYFPKRHRSDGSVLYIDWCYVDEKTVGQFTGLYDKNGKEIYEGDIIYMDSWSPHEYEIKFIEAAFCLAFISGHSKGEFAGDIHYIHHAEHNQSKIIGNIHDNLELIKEG